MRILGEIFKMEQEKLFGITFQCAPGVNVGTASALCNLLFY